MKIDTLSLKSGNWQSEHDEITHKQDCQLVVVFGETDCENLEAHLSSLRQSYPAAQIVGASSSGNILGNEISSAPLVATAIQFQRGSVRLAAIDLHEEIDIEALSAELIKRLPPEGLKHVFVLSDGLNVNGSELVEGINRVAGGITVTGGLAGDGSRFQKTWVIADAAPRSKCIVAVGFYGEGLSIRMGCRGGWSSFGPERRVTRSQDNILYELDGKPALDLYREYLGSFAQDLPGSGMRFPLSVRPPAASQEVIRTLLAVNEKDKSITFAGNIPQGSSARLMRTDVDRLIAGAAHAAEDAQAIPDHRALALVVSCVGRRVVLNQITEEELEAVADVLGSETRVTGFYSYGEISPFIDRPGHCALHNQTLTLTLIQE